MDIVVENLCKAYEKKEVLKNVSCVFPEQKITCIMGESGVGKTTLLSILMGLEKPDDGSICGLEGRKISAVFQENRLFENLDAVTNIRITTGKKVEPIREMLQEMNLWELEKKPVREFSGGMKRRVAIARALLAEYDILIMDEPFQGLDAETKKTVAEVVKKHIAGKTVLFVTHDERECEFFGAERIELTAGKSLR